MDQKNKESGHFCVQAFCQIFPVFNPKKLRPRISPKKYQIKEMRTWPRISPFLWSQVLETFASTHFSTKKSNFNYPFGRNAWKAVRSKACERNREQCVEKFTI